MTAGANVPAFLDIVGEGRVERLATGFDFTEGPVWHPVEQHLIFSDMPGNQMRRWTEADGVTTFRKPSQMANGNTYDPRGRLLTCEHATSRVIRTELDGTITVLVSHYLGTELNSPNDIVVRRDGGIYFTDPSYGRMPYYGVERPQQLTFQGLFRVNEDGSDLTLLAKDFAQPNGLCFSADETRLFVNDTERQHIRVFDVSSTGRVTGDSIWATVEGVGEGAPDGMKIDTKGNLYCCGPGGVHVFDPDAQPLGLIAIPEVVANFTWGDADMRSVFLTASTSLYRVRTHTPGVPLF